VVLIPRNDLLTHLLIEVYFLRLCDFFTCQILGFGFTERPFLLSEYVSCDLCHLVTISSKLYHDF
jgi:hypothetical protein